MSLLSNAPPWMLVLTVVLAYIVAKLIGYIRWTRPFYKLPQYDVTLKDLPRKSLDAYPFFKKGHDQLGGIYALWAGPFPCIVMGQGKYIQHILKSQINIRKSKGAEDFSCYLGRGLLIDTGESWKFHRRALTNTFHFEVLRDYMSPMKKATLTFIDVIGEYSESNAEFDVLPYLIRMTLDVVNVTAMGRELDIQRSSDTKYSTALEQANTLLALRPNYLQYYFDWVWNMSEMGKKCNKYLEIVKAERDCAILERKLALEEEGIRGDIDLRRVRKGRLSFLDLMLTAKNADGTPTFTDEDVRDQVSTFMFAGHDTTAMALAWTIWEVAKNKEIQARIHTEVDEFFAQGDVDIDRLSDLVYLNAVIKETLRLYPSAPVLGRKVEEEFDCEGYTIPAGTEVLLHMRSVNTFPEDWQNPYVYDPDRWLSDKPLSHPYCYIPFSAGPRNCIGMKFAQQMLKTSLAYIFYHYDIKTSKKEMLREFVVVEKPHGGVPITITRRDVPHIVTSA
eukprot:Clim_evm153s210 gene=Clim_evmTU153s210